MKLLFDENLSPKLARLLVGLFPDSVHVRDVGLKAFESNYSRSIDPALIYSYFSLVYNPSVFVGTDVCC